MIRTNLVEINEELSELLDKQVWWSNRKLNRKCAMKIKKKQLPVEKLFNDRKEFIRLLEYNEEEHHFERKDKLSTYNKVLFVEYQLIIVSNLFSLPLVAKRMP